MMGEVKIGVLSGRKIFRVCDGEWGCGIHFVKSNNPKGGYIKIKKLCFMGGLMPPLKIYESFFPK